MKSFIKTIVSIFLLFFSIFCLCRWLENIQYKDMNTVVERQGNCTLYGNEECYILDNYVYTINLENGVVHIFDIQGNFLKSIYIPRSGGTIWTGISENYLYVYSVRCDLQINIIEETYTFKENVVYINPNDFIKQNNIDKQKTYKLTKNKIMWKDGNVLSKITLDAKAINTISKDIYFFLFALCFLAFMITSGFLKMFLKE